MRAVKYADSIGAAHVQGRGPDKYIPRGLPRENFGVHGFLEPFMQLGRAKWAPGPFNFKINLVHATFIRTLLVHTCMQDSGYSLIHEKNPMNDFFLAILAQPTSRTRRGPTSSPTRPALRNSSAGRSIDMPHHGSVHVHVCKHACIMYICMHACMHKPDRIWHWALSPER